jgi:hypothetical protein
LKVLKAAAEDQAPASGPAPSSDNASRPSRRRSSGGPSFSP